MRAGMLHLQGVAPQRGWTLEGNSNPDWNAVRDVRPRRRPRPSAMFTKDPILAKKTSHSVDASGGGREMRLRE
jgi:hypothetical protein